MANKLTSIPAEINQLTNLVGIDLRDNKLTSVPDLSKLTNLTYLGLSGNKLSEKQIQKVKDSLLQLKSVD